MIDYLISELWTRVDIWFYNKYHRIHRFHSISKRRLCKCNQFFLRCIIRRFFFWYDCTNKWLIIFASFDHCFIESSNCMSEAWIHAIRSKIDIHFVSISLGKFWNKLIFAKYKSSCMTEMQFHWISRIIIAIRWLQNLSLNYMTQISHLRYLQIW